MNEITDEELASFLEGSLPEERRNQVAEAIDNDKQLQAIVEAAIDIDSMLMFDELRLVKRNPQTEQKSATLSFVTSLTNTDSKWGKYLSRKDGERNGATEWEEENYRRAANKGKRSVQITTQKTVENKEDEHSYWGGVIIGVIVMIVIVLLKSCVFNNQ